MIFLVTWVTCDHMCAKEPWARENRFAKQSPDPQGSFSYKLLQITAGSRLLSRWPFLQASCISLILSSDKFSIIAHMKPLSQRLRICGTHQIYDISVLNMWIFNRNRLLITHHGKFLGSGFGFLTKGSLVSPAIFLNFPAIFYTSQSGKF